jgi:uncharacterized protein (DUF362 family)
MQSRSTVSVVRVSESVQASVREAMELAGWRKHVDPDRPVALKVNLGWDLFIPGSITSPWVLEGVIQTVREINARIYLVESDQVLENIQKVFVKMQLGKLCERYGVQWINMTSSEMVSIPLNGKIFQTLEIPKILQESQLITIPVMKTHAKTQITGALKNQWGCITKLRHNYHLVLTDALADINSVLRPVFCVMDATISLEGDGPKSGIPRITHRILSSADPVALDTVQAKLMGMDAASIAHLSACAARGIGTNDLAQIDMVGDPEASHLNFHFKPPRHNLVSFIEESLRRSVFRKLVFHTPLFLLMVAGAKIWYLLWFYLGKGRKHWKTILSDPYYGPEWRDIRGGSSS